ncbi:glycosyltransferase family 2 protein [Candidatus Gottesmanbacteria bacterium]|nr:glycosyltransferase family 2 protein [Candidatus Gottesmanbacteria bacterium]
MIPTISIVAPAYNEEAVLPLLCRTLFSVIDQIPTYTFEIIIVDNGSTDQTLSVLFNERNHDKRIKIIQLVRNVGVDHGMLAGLTYAHGDASIVMNADLQDNPKLISRFLKKWEAGYDMVYAIIRSRKGVSQAYQLFIRALYKALHILTIGKVPENVSDYRLLDRSVYVKIVEHRHRYVFFRVIAALQSHNSIGIPYDRPMRLYGTSKMNISQYIADIRNAIVTLIVHELPPIHTTTPEPTRSLFPVTRTWGFTKHI